MKIKMSGTDWKEVGDLVGITSITLSPELDRGTVFSSKGGIEIFFSQKDMEILGDEGDVERRF